MNKYQSFIFKRYDFNEQNGTLNLYYSFDDVIEFCETYTFNFTPVKYNKRALDRAIQLLFFMAGISYYKAYLPSQIIVRDGNIDKPLAEFLSKTYEKGLGEFFYVNSLNPRTSIKFPSNAELLEPIEIKNQSGQLIGLGGGKDSLVSVELLRKQPRIATWSLNHRSQLEPLVRRTGSTHYWVDRTLDALLQQLNKQDALNGHIPISAIFSCVGTIVSILTGFQDNIVSNENSASEPTLHYKGSIINHQYSKSLEYEKDFQSCLLRLFGSSIRYYSFLRPLSELYIAEIFVKLGFKKYRDVFSSCNRAYTHGQSHMFWCGKCPKCAFVFLMLTPFLERTEIEKLWGGKNLLLDQSQEQTYRQLLGIEGIKPFDCVGEIKEARSAMYLAQKIYPDLNKYKFSLTKDYDYKDLSIHSMPQEIYYNLKKSLMNL